MIGRRHLHMVTFLVLLFLLGCEKDKQEMQFSEAINRITYDPYSEDPIVTFMVDEGSSASIEIEKDIHKTLNYTKIPFQTISIEGFNSGKKLGEHNRVLIITNPGDIELESYERILNFIGNGGTVILPNVSSSVEFDYLAGLNPGADHSIDTDAYGFISSRNILPDFKNKIFKENLKLYGLAKENFSDGVEILATASNDEEYPAIVQNTLGNGKVILLNTSQGLEKRDRGLLFSLMMLGLEGIPYPISNSSSIFLDDFPAPLYGVSLEPVKTELNISQSEFYTEHWWPDMLQLAKNEDIVYSGFVCFDYRNTTSPPFNFEEWDHSKKRHNGKLVSASGWLMDQFQTSNHHLGLHGYNHASLIDRDWSSFDYMKLSLEAARKRWQLKNYSSMPVAYVPPSNNIDSLGFAALKNVFPSIKFNSSLYLGNFEEGGLREFDEEPYNEHFFNFPRITSGYVLNAANQYNQQSLFLYTGIWTHFIHADDIFQIPENLEEKNIPYEYRNLNRLGWKVSNDGSPGLLPRFTDYVRRIKKMYPLMRFLPVREAAANTKNWRTTNFDFSTSNEKIMVNSSSETENWWMVYYPKSKMRQAEDHLASRGYTYSKTNFQNGNLYMVKTNSGKIELPAEKKINGSNINLKENFFAFSSEEAWDTLPDSTGEIEELKEQITTAKSFSKSKWNELFKYLSWNDRQYEIWPLLKSKYEEDKDPAYLSLASELVSGSDYPNLETRKYWMLAKLEGSEKLQSKIDYIEYFGEGDEVYLNQSELLEILQDRQVNSKDYYLELLLQRYPEAANDFLINLAPCDESSHFNADMVSWYFADIENYDKAIAWSKCSSEIDQNTIDQWTLRTGNWKMIKEKNYSQYVLWLLNENPAKATQELMTVDACSEDLNSIASSIAYAYGNQGSYRKALEWSRCSPEFPKETEIYWLSQLEETEQMEGIYRNLDKNGSTDIAEIQQLLISYYIGQGDFKKAWKMADSMAESKVKSDLKVQLNRDVLYADRAVQKSLLLENPEFFEEMVSDKIRKQIRESESDFLRIDGNMISDRFDPNYYEVKVGYGFRDKSLHTHILSFVKNQAYEVPVSQQLADNRDQSLYGINYLFSTNPQPEKLNVKAGGRIEWDGENDLYYQLQAGLSISWDSLYSSLAAFRRPALTGGAYSLKIYQTQLNIYEEFRINKRFRTTLYLEGNHYDDDGTIDGTINLAFYSNLFRTNKSKLFAFTEGAGMLGNMDKPGGYPYWTLKERLYGGLGMGYDMQTPMDKLKLNIDASHFLDTFSGNFQRYRGGFNYEFSNQFFINANAEFYTLKNFYSNNFNLGLNYYL